MDLPPLRRRLIGGGMWAFAGKAILLVMGLVTSAILTRLLPPAAVGAYFLIYTVVTVSAMIARLGLEKSVLQLVAESLGKDRPGRARAVVGRVFSLATAGAVVVGGLYWFVVGPWLTTSVFHSPSMQSAVKLTAAWIVLLTYQVLEGETFRGHHDIMRATLYGGTLCSLLTGAFLAVAWWWTGTGDLTLAVLLSLAATLTSVLVGSSSLFRRVRSLGRAESVGVRWGKIMRGAAPLLVSNVTLYVLGRADLWIVGGYLTKQDVALYGAASRVALLVSTSLVIAAQVLPPVIGELQARDQGQRLERILRFAAGAAMVPSLLVGLVFIVGGGPVLALLFGGFYRSGGTVLAVLSLAQLLNVWVGACGYTLIMSGHQKPLMWGSIGAGAVAVGGGMLAVHWFGIVGVAAATAVAVTVQQVYMLLAARRLCGLWTHARFRGLVGAMRSLIGLSLSSS